MSIGALVESIGGEPKPKALDTRPNVLIEIITRRDKEAMMFLDVAYQQALPANKGAVFQVAFGRARCQIRFSPSPRRTRLSRKVRIRYPKRSSIGSCSISRLITRALRRKSRFWQRRRGRRISVRRFPRQSLRQAAAKPRAAREFLDHLQHSHPHHRGAQWSASRKGTGC